MKRILISLIRFYQKWISPFTANSCRFYPSCSQYAIDALEKKGVIKGSLKAGWRILRCNPWNKHFGHDPVD
ncbi:membrane protein insertion efficiency factor YidD [bacterium]|nr:membrane protein insertion efficiency factor YidD [bacterium]